MTYTDLDMTTNRAAILDRINTLVRSDNSSRGCDRAIALITQYEVTATELITRRRDRTV